MFSSESASIRLPPFQNNRMIEDIEQGKINMVVTKDLSRLGRDYIEGALEALHEINIIGPI